jgi:hypothetical protein
MGDVVPFRTPEAAPANNMCPCGSAWFTATVCLNGTAITGYQQPLHCAHCGNEYAP